MEEDSVIAASLHHIDYCPRRAAAASRWVSISAAP